MKTRTFRKSPCAFSNLEALVVIVTTMALSFVLVPALAYQMGWMQPVKSDIDINWRPMTHPGASFVPKNHLLNTDEDQKNDKGR